MSNYRLSDFGRLSLEFEEGESQKPYKDIAGHWTIGKGHKLLSHESHKRLKGSDIENLFNKDIIVREGELNSGMDLILSQHQFDAIFILCFNIGVKKFLTSTAYKMLKLKRFECACLYWKSWKNITDHETKKKKVSKGLVSRRAREINLFCNDLKNIEDYKKCLALTK